MNCSCIVCAQNQLLALCHTPFLWPWRSILVEIWWRRRGCSRSEVHTVEKSGNVTVTSLTVQWMGEGGWLLVVVEHHVGEWVNVWGLLSVSSWLCRLFPVHLSFRVPVPSPVHLHTLLVPACYCFYSQYSTVLALSVKCYEVLRWEIDSKDFPKYQFLLWVTYDPMQENFLIISEMYYMYERSLR